MNIDQLKALRAICRYGTFSRAAHELYITQPALSMQIRALEDHVGEPLFRKSGRRKVLTPAGETVLEHASRIVDELDALNASIEAMKGLEAGEVSVAAGDTVTRYLLLNALQTFTKRFPTIHIRLWNKTSPEIAAMLREGRVDVGVVTLPVTAKDFEVSLLRSYRYVAVAGPENAFWGRRRTVTLTELAKRNLLLLEPGTRTRDTIESSFRARGISCDQVMDLGSVDLQKHLARIGVGVAIVPDFAVAATRDADGVAVAVIRNTAHNRLGLIVRRARMPSASAAFTAHLRECMTIRP